MSPIHAIEAHTLLHGSEMASQIGISDFILELDNLEVVRKCHATNKNDRSLMGHLIQEICETMRGHSQT